MRGPMAYLAALVGVLAYVGFALWYMAWWPADAWSRYRRRREFAALREEYERGTIFRLRQRGGL